MISLIDSVIKVKNTDSVIKGRNISQNDTFLLELPFFPTHCARYTRRRDVNKPMFSRQRPPVGWLYLYVYWS